MRQPLQRGSLVLAVGESIAPDEAMLFVFPVDDLYGFWMNDILMPVDIFWLDAQGQVVSIEQDVAPETYPNVFIRRSLRDIVL